MDETAKQSGVDSEGAAAVPMADLEAAWRVGAAHMRRAETWERRWRNLRDKHKNVAAECDRLRTALDELNADVEEMLSRAGQNGIEDAKSHAIRTQMATIRRMRFALRENSPEASA